MGNFVAIEIPDNLALAIIDGESREPEDFKGCHVYTVTYANGIQGVLISRNGIPKIDPILDTEGNALPTTRVISHPWPQAYRADLVVQINRASLEYRPEVAEDDESEE